MPDTATKIISLLERLSVVAPERCKDTGFPSFAIRALAMLCEGDWVVVGTLYKDGWEFTAPIIHYAVLEEAHLRKLEWNVFQSVSLIDSSGIRVMTVGLSRNPSPIETTAAYLECLVLALESQS